MDLAVRIGVFWHDRNIKGEKRKNQRMIEGMEDW